MLQKGKDMTIQVKQVTEVIAGTVVPSTWGDVYIIFGGSSNA